MFVVQPERQATVRSVLAELEEIEIGHETHGSEVVIPFHSG
jgi:hypothetical protein